MHIYELKAPDKYEACFINFGPILIICISGLGWIINPGNEVIDKG